ncbi:hypothetical protein ACIGXF_36950 [Streptomyces sp. NPDC053086]|uniref:hypothetical protein n=1 Tax=unclassified Streptomyces TaxID=2593676 RepID=UPI0037D4FD78
MDLAEKHRDGVLAVVQVAVDGGGFGEFVDQRAALAYRQERELEGLSDREEPGVRGHRIRPFLLCGSELEEFWNALSVLVGLEAGEKVVDELHAAGCSDATCQEQGLGGGGRGGLGFLQIEVARGAVGEKHPAGLVPDRGEQAFAFGDELVGAADVTEVQEGLAGVHGEIGFYVGASFCLTKHAVMFA